jgi:hypothetical protein
MAFGCFVVVVMLQSQVLAEGQGVACIGCRPVLLCIRQEATVRGTPLTAGLEVIR